MIKGEKYCGASLLPIGVSAVFNDEGGITKGDALSCNGGSTVFGVSCTNSVIPVEYDTVGRYKFMNRVYNANTCKDGHLNIICKFCGNFTASWISHSILCKQKIGREFRINETIHINVDSITGNTLDISWFIAMWEVLDKIPQLLMLDTCFDEIINDNFMAELIFTSDRMRSWTTSFCQLYMTKSTPRCVLCNQYYDSFPTYYECQEHINSAKCSPLTA